MDRPAAVAILTSGAVLVVGRSLLLKQYRALYERMVDIFRVSVTYSIYCDTADTQGNGREKRWNT